MTTKLTFPTAHLSTALLLTAAVTSGGCEEWANGDLIETAAADVELVCPLTELPDVDLGPLPDFDPVRAASEPDRGACGIPARTVQRLNRSAYNNAVRDIFLVDVKPSEKFPLDDTSDGFDNQGDVLAMAPVLVEKYLAAAHEVVDAALSKGAPPSENRIWEAEAAWGGTDEEATTHKVNNNASRNISFTIGHSATYRFHIRAYGEQAGGEPVQMGVRFNDAAHTIFDVTETADVPGRFTVETHLEKGENAINIYYLNDYLRIRNNDDAALDRNLILDFVELEGPLDAAPEETPASRTALLTCDPEEVGVDACATEIISRVARLAFRRTPSATEIERLKGFVTLTRASGGDFEEGLKAAFRAILVSPSFLFLVERDENPMSPLPHNVSGVELASRLAMFLWTSVPDDRLLTIAEMGALTDPVVLEQEVRRMILDKKSRALVDEFAGQWLQSRGVDDVIVDGIKNPGADRTLLRSMRCETELVVDEILRSDAPIKDLLLADFTYVNRPLADHYEMRAPNVEAAPGAHKDSGFARVSLDDTVRTGVLTHGGLLALGSHPLRTSPVRRGKFVLDQLLCIPPEPPPPNVEGLPTEPVDGATLRDVLEEHRANPVCASCHVMMDPIGLGLENFDELGRYRTKDNGFDIDASEVFMGLTPFDGPKELAQLIADDDNFASCVTEKTMTFALGRSFLDEDVCARDAIIGRLVEDGLPLREILVEVALSAPFRMRRASPEDPVNDVENPPLTTAGDNP